MSLNSRLNSTIATLLFSASLVPLLLASTPVLADEVQVQDNRPDRYTVQKGDTLWGISGKFLKQPWRWPEIWRMNRDQIKNPHWIYPGDVVVLDRVDGNWRLSLNRPAGPRPNARLSPSIRVEGLAGEAIPTIPAGDLAPFLSRPIITATRDGVPGTAKIIAAHDNRVVRGEGDYVYAVDIDEKFGTQWFIYRPGKMLRSYDSNELLGYELRFLGTARVDRFGASGEVARMEITSAREEILMDDMLLPAPREELANYVPHAPDKAVDGRIIALDGDAHEVGRNSLVTIDRGARDGVDVGTVLAIYHPTPVIPDPRPSTEPSVMSRFISDPTRDMLQPTRYLNIPPERSGLLFVFRVFDKVAYGIVLNASEPVVTGDLARKP
ncbi:MAG: LysM peptidoglycan-binding domain-containing protein [Betaproteobacteria bacterium]